MEQTGLFEEDFLRVTRWIDGYFEHPERYAVLPNVRPGEIAAQLPAHAPESGESFEAIMSDFERIIVPGITHWNHPRFFAYFSISAAPVTILAEALAAALDVNAMLWRTSPAATELEDVTLDWLRQMLGLPPAFHGIIYDTASISGYTALAAAALCLRSDTPTCLFVIGGVVLALVFIGIHNAWDTVTYLAVDPDRRAESAEISTGLPIKEQE